MHIIMKMRKTTYKTPVLTVVCTAPMQMLAASGDTPEVHTTTEKVSTSHEALTRGYHHKIWDNDWSE